MKTELSEQEPRTASSYKMATQFDRKGCLIEKICFTDQKTSKFFVSPGEESMAGHLGVNGAY
jgi:hypothetical protein